MMPYFVEATLIEPCLYRLHGFHGSSTVFIALYSAVKRNEITPYYGKLVPELIPYLTAILGDLDAKCL